MVSRLNAKIFGQEGYSSHKPPRDHLIRILGGHANFCGSSFFWIFGILPLWRLSTCWDWPRLTSGWRVVSFLKVPLGQMPFWVLAFPPLFEDCCCGHGESFLCIVRRVLFKIKRWKRYVYFKVFSPRGPLLSFALSYFYYNFAFLFSCIEEDGLLCRLFFIFSWVFLLEIPVIWSLLAVGML
jgi:hypothetical protein